jgi:hypothetical protein
VEFAKIVALAVFGAVTYGIVHDQITIRVCVEYFTIGHPHLIHTASPTVLALAWGIAATWWVGLVLGLLVALAARRGNRPKLRAVQIVPDLLWLISSVALLALVTGFSAYFLAVHSYIALPQEWGELLPVNARVPFLVDASTHLASYTFGIIGGLLVALRAYRHRQRKWAV